MRASIPFIFTQAESTLILRCKEVNEEMTYLTQTCNVERQARELAYGFMVKGYQRDTLVLSLLSEREQDELLEIGSQLAHLSYIKIASRDLLPEVLNRGNTLLLFVDNKETRDTIISSIPSDSSVEIFVASSDSVDSTSIDYLQMIGRSWEYKYKPSVDRIYREIYPYSAIG